jgi:hypothetical protein
MKAEEALAEAKRKGLFQEQVDEVISVWFLP